MDNEEYLVKAGQEQLRTAPTIKNNERISKSKSFRNSTNVCNFYSKYNNCKFGDKCKLLHQENDRFNDKCLTNLVGEPSHSDDKQTHSKNIQKNSEYSEKEFHSAYYYNNRSKNRFKQPCRYFKSGYCERGSNCNYSHSTQSARPDNRAYTSSKSGKPTRKDFSALRNTKSNSIPVCRYFKEGFCYKGNACRYLHTQKTKEKKYESVNQDTVNGNDSKDEEIVCEKNESTLLLNELDLNLNSCTIQESIPSCEESKGSCSGENLSNSCSTDDNSKCNLHSHKRAEDDGNRPATNKHRALQNVKFFDLASLSDQEMLKIRDTEIVQFRKRFPNCEEDETNETFKFIFQPSDPDWPYDIKNLYLQTTFPLQYPVEVCKICVIYGAEYISDVVLRYINDKISEWLLERHEYLLKQGQVELLFRPFLRWFDKTLEEMFNSALKKVKTNADDTESNVATVVDSNDFCEPPEDIGDPLDTQEKHEQLSETSNLQSASATNICQTDNQNKGTKILFMGLEFVEGAAGLSCAKIAATVLCSRCKTPCNIKTLPNKNNSQACSKCSKRFEFNFNPSFLHAYSNVVGTFHLVDCQAVDVNVVESAFLVDCLNCSKQVPVDGLHYGQTQKSWCKFCNQKLIILIQSVKFQGTISSSSAESKPSATKKAEKKKDPVVKEGQSLPDLGTCKHYKKSYRWLRFPCCGRLYPCDICHDEKEATHDMKFASRMICGFCSKEQPYSKDKPCISCGGSVVSKHSSHWQGGKGCTNKIAMSRHDKQKYGGSSKTVSKKSQKS